MKDFSILWIIIGFAVILGVGIWEQSYLETFTKEMVEEINSVEKLVYSGNIKDGADTLQNIIKKWEKREKLLGVVINHEDINKISETLLEIDSKLKFFSHSDNISANFALVREYILYMANGNEFSTNNVL